MGFWNWVKRTFGFGKKEPEVTEESQKVEISEIKKAVSEPISELEDQDEKEIERPEEPKEERMSRFERRQRERIKGKEILTGAKKRAIENEINPSGIVIRIGGYDNANDLRESKYDIYRNIILKNINNRDMINRIYSSGILNEHIVGYISIHGFVRHKTRGRQEYTETIEVQGMTPDKVLEEGIYQRLEGKKMSLGELRNTLMAIGGVVDVRIPNSYEETITIEKVSISFDYA